MGTRVLAVAAWAFCAFFALNLVLTGTAGAVWHFLPPLMLVSWAVHLLLWRPRLLVGTGGLTVVNILREHHVPFAALKAVRVGQSVSLDTTAGRIASWGAPGAGRLGPRPGGGPQPAGRVPGPARTQAAIDSAWNAWELAAREKAATSLGVTSRWNVPAVVVTVMLAGLVAAGTLV